MLGVSFIRWVDVESGAHRMLIGTQCWLCQLVFLSVYTYVWPCFQGERFCDALTTYNVRNEHVY